MVRNYPFRLKPHRGSHLPLLMKAIERTTGPVLELGCGTYSTQYLHWACFPAQRTLVTYEHNPAFYDYIHLFETDWHEVRCLPDWSQIDLSAPWSVALVDSDNGLRGSLVSQLLHAEYVVCHDTEDRGMRKYGYLEPFRLFRYQWRWERTWPNTTILSNTHDLSDMRLP